MDVQATNVIAALRKQLDEANYKIALLTAQLMQGIDNDPSSEDDN